ncbi:transcriptional regulator [Archaeoglobales archaeon]|nr:MAG: transcriptional regulator [Archaeoglobales archaeon]
MAEDMNKAILKALKELNKPAKSKEIAEKIGVPTSKVSCRLAPLKKKGLLDSPQKGLWVLTEEGKKALKS